jgi:ABC-type multidrug transport system fused ATPase/permease subunit
MKKDAIEMKSEILPKMSVLITTAFGLIAALAWNQAIQAIILQLLPKQSGILGLLIYAIIITIIAVIATVGIARVISKPAVQEVRIVE